MSAPSDATLQQFLILAKNSKGKAASMVVQQALNAPGLYHFGELLAHPNIAALEQADPPSYQLIKVFAYGNLAEFRATAGLPQLTPQQLNKLRQLTLVSLSSDSKVISYLTLQTQLEISNVRELEDLIIDCIYSGLVRGKLDQKAQTLQVDFVVSRDIRPGSIEGMIRTLTAWCDQSDQMLKTIDQLIGSSQSSYEANRIGKKDFEERYEALKKSVAAQEGQSHGVDPFEDDGRGRKGYKRGGGGGGGGARKGTGKHSMMQGWMGY